ncbi:MAG: hypothetical protein GY913_07940 [Proteobacteria bacterium]|nr:hypothetical protein [Pseudomonadota bacterium]MCP4916843.1 hypothetical protein [Pseudomonadota bacterium]
MILLLACAPGIEHQTLELSRDVHFAVPEGDDLPVALVFQGAMVKADRSWSGPVDGQIAVTEALLDVGFVVVTPEAHNGGHTWWDTNQPPWTWRWEDSPDAVFMDELFEALDAGELGPVDPDRIHAVGISSGGYMTSRMAVEFPDRLSSVAIHSASYMTCSGSLCRTPEVEADHPEVQFLHGSRDTVVPVRTA